MHRLHDIKEKQHSSTAYYQALTRRMVLIVIIVSFTSLALVSLILLYHFRIAYLEKTHAHLGELIQKHKQNIDSFLLEKMSNIRLLAENFSFDDFQSEAFTQEKLTMLQKEYGSVFTDLGVVNEKGVQISYAGPFNLVQAKYSDTDWFRKAINRKNFISDVFLGLRGHPHFIIAVRKTTKGNHWILRATIDFGAFNTLVENLRIGRTGFAFIINREGEFQTKSLFDFNPCKECYTDLLKIREDSKGPVYITERIYGSGKKNIYAAALLKDGDWLLIFKQETADAFSDLTRMQYIAAIIFISGGFAIIAMAFIYTQKIIFHIAETDKEKEIMNRQVIETGKLASVGELAAGIAHEINNPVAIMMEEAGWIEDLLEEEEFGKSENLTEFYRALKQINTQGKRCKEITHKLLSFARKTDTTLKDVQINELVKEIIELSAQMAKYNKVTINTSLQEDLPFIKISPSEIQQVFLNLINNALYFMEKTGGMINILTKLSELEKDHIVIVVEDNGPGIPEANLSKIFDPFFTTKPVGKGTGLGLSICYGIIQKLGGKIDVSSTVDVGSRFRIWIPFQEEEELIDTSDNTCSYDPMSQG